MSVYFNRTSCNLRGGYVMINNSAIIRKFLLVCLFHCIISCLQIMKIFENEVTQLLEQCGYES